MVGRTFDNLDVVCALFGVVVVVTTTTTAPAAAIIIIIITTTTAATLTRHGINTFNRNQLAIKPLLGTTKRRGRTLRSVPTHIKPLRTSARSNNFTRLRKHIRTTLVRFPTSVLPRFHAPATLNLHLLRQIRLFTQKHVRDNQPVVFQFYRYHSFIFARIFHIAHLHQFLRLQTIFRYPISATNPGRQQRRLAII